MLNDWKIVLRFLKHLVLCFRVSHFTKNNARTIIHVSIWIFFYLLLDLLTRWLRRYETSKREIVTRDFTKVEPSHSAHPLTEWLLTLSLSAFSLLCRLFRFCYICTNIHSAYLSRQHLILIARFLSRIVSRDKSRTQNCVFPLW